MAITKAQLIDDLELLLNQGEISQDSVLEKDQLAFWISQCLNQLVANECNSKISRSEMIPAIYIKKQSFEELEDSDETVGDDRVYVELDEEPLTLNNGMGVLIVEDEDGNNIKKADIQTLQLFKNMRFSKPSADNVVYSAEGTKIFLPGLKPVDVPFDGMNVWYIPKQDLLTLADTDEVLVSDLVLPVLIEMVLQKGKPMLYGTTPDQENDGQDVKNVQYHTAIRRNTQPEQE